MAEAENLDDPTWSLLVTEDWELRETEGGVELQAKEPVGLLEFAALLRDDRDFTDDDLKELCEEQLGPEAPLIAVDCGQFSGFGTAFESEDTSWKVFVLRSGRQMLFTTYHCALDDDGKEDDLVDEMLSTLSVAE